MWKLNLTEGLLDPRGKRGVLRDDTLGERLGVRREREPPLRHAREDPVLVRGLHGGVPLLDPRLARAVPAAEFGRDEFPNLLRILAEVPEPLLLPVPVLIRVRRLLILALVAVGVQTAHRRLVLAPALARLAKVFDQVDDVVPPLEPPGFELVNLIDDPAVARDEDVGHVRDVRL